MWESRNLLARNMPTSDMDGFQGEDHEELVPRGPRLVLPQQHDPQGADQGDALAHREHYVDSPEIQTRVQVTLSLER